MMSRQSGKNELAAVLHAYLLYLWALEGGDIIVAAPSFKPQIVNSERRLHEVLDMPISHDLWEPHRGYYLELGKATAVVLLGGSGGQRRRSYRVDPAVGRRGAGCRPGRLPAEVPADGVDHQRHDRAVRDGLGRGQHPRGAATGEPGDREADGGAAELRSAVDGAGGDEPCL